jgi:hypothetical protein
MLVSSTSMKVASITVMAISQGLTAPILLDPASAEEEFADTK